MMNDECRQNDRLFLVSAFSIHHSAFRRLAATAHPTYSITPVAAPTLIATSPQKTMADAEKPDKPQPTVPASSGLSLRHTLEFEKPLASLELQIKELEAVQNAKGVDYS